MARKRWVFVSDTHAPAHLPQAVALVAAWLKDYPPDYLILGGDIFEFALASKFLRLNTDRGPRTVAEECIIGVEEVVRPLAEAVGDKCEKYFLEGNHEIRIRRLLAAARQGTDSLWEPEQRLGCREYGIKYIGSRGGNAKLTIGPATFMHGDRYGLNPARLILQHYGGPLVVFGHAHKESIDRKKMGNGLDWLSIGAGCLCRDPDWRDYDNYTRGFAAGWLDEETGDYWGDHIAIKGQAHSYLYCAKGEWSAKCTYDKNGNERWVAERVGHPSKRRSPKEG